MQRCSDKVEATQFRGTVSQFSNRTESYIETLTQEFQGGTEEAKELLLQHLKPNAIATGEEVFHKLGVLTLDENGIMAARFGGALSFNPLSYNQYGVLDMGLLSKPDELKIPNATSFTIGAHEMRHLFAPPQKSGY